MRSTLVRATVLAAASTSVVFGVATSASAAPCVHVADCMLQQEANDGDPNAGMPESSVLNVTDGFWTDVLDFLSGSGWDF